jgi:septal ring factor EnvC (AmiA/AmiB activator)
MRKSSIVFCSVISVSFLMLAGCASKPTTTADLMRGHAIEVQAEADLKSQLAKDWEKGAKLLSSGEKRIKDGERRMKLAERDLKQAQDDIERGRREIAEGQNLILESERQFRENFPELDIQPGK